MEFRLALKDSDEGIKLDPTFRKIFKRNEFNESFEFFFFQSNVIFERGMH